MDHWQIPPRGAVPRHRKGPLYSGGIKDPFPRSAPFVDCKGDAQGGPGRSGPCGAGMGQGHGADFDSLRRFDPTDFGWRRLSRPPVGFDSRRCCLIQKLGAGGMGVVGLYEREDTGRPGASCFTTPTSATWYVFGGPMTKNPLYQRLKAAGITVTTYEAYSWGITGTQSCGPPPLQFEFPDRIVADGQRPDDRQLYQAVRAYFWGRDRIFGRGAHDSIRDPRQAPVERRGCWTSVSRGNWKNRTSRGNVPGKAHGSTQRSTPRRSGSATGMWALIPASTLWV